MRLPGPTELALLGLLALGVLLHVVISPDPGRRNWEYMPDMVDSPACEAQDPNPVLPGGRTLQVPVEGTVARGFLPLVDRQGAFDTTTPWGKLTAAERDRWNALDSPHDLEEMPDEERAALLARGRHVFQNVCSTCHGPTGAGGGAVTKRGVPPPPTLLDRAMRERTDGRIYRAFVYGKGNMAPHGNHVAREDRWKVIHYLRSLQAEKP